MEKIKLAAVALVCGAIAMSVLTSGAQEKRVNEKMPTQGIAKGPFDVKIAPIETAHKDVKEIARYSAEKCTTAIWRGVELAKCWPEWEQ